MAHTPSAEPLDQVDPHHELPHHGHVIIRPRTLVAVLTALLFLTFLTVGASRAEVWIAETFNIPIPHLMNVIIALSIAVVKCTLVALFFMQLKYDNPLNALVFLFCLFALALFLFFSMTDLGTRGFVYAFKDGEKQKGGMGIDSRMVDTGTVGIVAWARQARIEKIGQLASDGKLNPPLEPGELPAARYAKEFAKIHASHGGHSNAKPEHSTANYSIPPTPGATPGLYEGAPAGGHEEPGHGH